MGELFIFWRPVGGRKLGRKGGQRERSRARGVGLVVLKAILELSEEKRRHMCHTPLNGYIVRSHRPWPSEVICYLEMFPNSRGPQCTDNREEEDQRMSAGLRQPAMCTHS